MFIFRWSSNFVEKVVFKGSMAAKMASRVSYLVYYNCIYSEFEQIITEHNLKRWTRLGRGGGGAGLETTILQKTPSTVLILFADRNAST